MKQPALQGHTLVLRGNFNPSIFQPAWFGAQSLLPNAAVASAKISIVRPEVTVFSIEWCRIEVTEDRFAIGSTHEAYFERLADLVIKTFRILIHTPVHMMGINYDVHFSAQSEEKWHEFGHKLAPKQIWKEMFANPGLRSLTIEESIRPDGHAGHIQAKVEPSTKIQPGIYININDHFVSNTQKEVADSQEIITLLEAEHQNSLARSKDFAQKIMEEA